jgi:hypothetical protein
VFIGQGNKPETEAAQFNDFVDHALIPPLARLLSIGPPDAAKRAMLWTSPNGLHRFAAARTNNHRGVMTAVPKELSLGFTR